MNLKEEKIVKKYKLKKKNKKKTITKGSLKRRFKTSQSFTNVSNIEDNGYLTLKDGSVAIIYEVTSLDLSLSSSEQKFSFFNSLKYLYQIKDLDLRIYKLDEPLNLNANKDFIGEMLDKYRNDEQRYNFLCERYALLEKLESNDFTTTGVYYFVLIAKNNEILRKQIDEVIRICSTTNPKIKLKNIDNKYLVYSFLINLYFCNYGIEQLLWCDLVDLLSPLNITEKSNILKTDSDEIQLISIKSVPPFLDELFFEQLFNYPNAKCCIHIKDTIDTDSLIKKLDNSYQFLLSDRMTTSKLSDATEMDTQKENYQVLMNEIKNGDEKIKEVNFLIAISGDKKKREEIVKELKRLANYFKIKLDVVRLRQYEAWQSFDISPKILKDYVIYLPTLSLAAGFPLTSTSFNDSNGVLMGVDIHSCLPVFFDIFKNDKTSRISYNMSIVASTGGGKSFMLKKLLIDNLYNGDNKIFIFDTDSEYKKLALRNNGTVINLYSKSGGIINPLQIRLLPEDSDGEIDSPLAKHLGFLESFYKNAFEEISEKELVVLLEETELLYNNFGITNKSSISMVENMGVREFPVFSDLKEKIKTDTLTTKSQEKRRILEQLDILINRFLIGTDAFLFNDYTNIELKNSNLICFDLQELLSSENIRLINAQLLNTLTYLNNEIVKNRLINTKENTNKHIIVAFEEIHLFKNRKYSAILKQIESLARRSRKYNCSTICTTQSIHDFVDNYEDVSPAKAIFNNCQYQLAGEMKENDLAAYIELFKENPLTDTQREFLNSVKQGQFLFNIDSNKRLRLWVQATPLERYLMGEN